MVAAVMAVAVMAAVVAISGGGHMGGGHMGGFGGGAHGWVRRRGWAGLAAHSHGQGSIRWPGWAGCRRCGRATTHDFAGSMGMGRGGYAAWVHGQG